jgi:hypothetical protein
VARTERDRPSLAVVSLTWSTSFPSAGARESAESSSTEAKRRDYSRIHLWTDEDNERSQRLYRSRGFSPTGRTAAGEGEWARKV